MQSSKKVYAIVPARGGSKGIPKKNIVSLAGFPLIAHSIIAAKMAKQVDRVIVSTDSEEIAEVARRFGAEVPFLRPAEISQDHSIDREFVMHALEWFRDNEGEVPAYLIHLRPTIPIRDPADIDASVKKIRAHKDATSLRSAHPSVEVVFKDFKIVEGYFAGLFPHDPRPEYYNLPRQHFPPTYHSNGYIDILVTSPIIAGGSLHGSRILPLVTAETIDIDTREDLARAEKYLRQKPSPVLLYLRKHYTRSGGARRKKNAPSKKRKAR